jgi:hypothetical protein
MRRPRVWARDFLVAEMDALEGPEVIDQLGRRALQNDTATAQDARPVGHGECLAGVLFHREYAHPVFVGLGS